LKEPPPINDGELVIVSIQYIDDHFMAPGMGGDAKLFRKTSVGLEAVDIRGAAIALLSWHICERHPSRSWHGSDSAREESRRIIADCIVQMAEAFRIRGETSESNKWLQHVEDSYPDTPAAQRASESMMLQ